MTYTVTYVQMTDPGQLNPSPPVPGLHIEALAASSPLIPGLLSRIGAPHGWRSASRTAADWAAWLHENPARRHWVFTFHGQPAGMVVFEPHPGNEVEIKSFGLVPESVGKGLGGFALTLAIEQAWSLRPGVTRVWLHTSSKDHAHALPNYHRRGFSTYETRQVDEP